MQSIGKKAIALLLAVAMLCVIPVIGAQAEEAFTSQLKTDIGLFRIDDPHRAGQEFVLDFAQMQTVRAYLEMENANTTVTVSIHSNVNETPIRSQASHFKTLSMAG